MVVLADVSALNHFPLSTSDLIQLRLITLPYLKSMSDKPQLLRHLTPQEWETLIDERRPAEEKMDIPDISSQPDRSRSFRDDEARVSSAGKAAHNRVYGGPVSLNKLVEASRAVLQAPVDGVSMTFSLKQQMLTSVSSVLISCGECKGYLTLVESLVELLLTVINRPNFGSGRQTRALGCECLRELERANPWLSVSIMSSSVHLIPFNVPSWMIEEEIGVGGKREISVTGFKELRRAMAFLLQAPHILTPSGMVEFMTRIMPIALSLDLQLSMLKVQFVGMMCSFDPMFCQMVLMMYMQAPDSFDSQEGEVINRLVLVSKAGNHYLFFRLLALHWLLGLTGLGSINFLGNKKAALQLGLKVCPGVFDPLALKALKLDLLALCSGRLSLLNSEQNEPMGSADDGLVADSESLLVKLFKDGLLSVSAFKWLPPRSSETAMMLIDLTLEFRKLVPVVLAFVDRLLRCHKHRLQGKRLLQMFDKLLLPRLKVDNKLVSYFPIFGSIAETDAAPPRGLLELLLKFIIPNIKKHGPGTVLRSWSQGSKVLGICRTLLMHHHSSRLFARLSRLLAFTCLYFPNLEVCDNARIYLRMLVCIPGKKLRFILNFGEQLTEISPSSHFVQSPRVSHDPRKSRSISSYIHLERLVPLLVTQSWSLSLLGLSGLGGKPEDLEVIGDSQPLVDDIEPDHENMHLITESGESDHPLQPLLVMDSKIAEVLTTLRKHFSCIPDFRNMAGLKITVKCTFRFQAEPFSRVWGLNSSSTELEGADAVPALYAAVLRFSSSAPYGSIPPRRIPFLAPVSLELEPREPTPGLVDVYIEANAENGQIIKGQLQGITIGIEDMFLKAITPQEIREDEIPDYYSCLEIFPIKGGKGVVVINGTRSVKLLEVPAASVIQATERHLAPFIVTVTGGVLQLKYTDEEDEMDSHVSLAARNMGCIFVLIFLPPSDFSTLVRFRTDHWPCLAYVDDYLEALFLS
uniref:AP5B1 middle domain-containing protein n=1 Tax=Kalanchoe fedtschenkoi TaxID=63787 RepID=A0A7N0U7H4_KALFE